MCFKKNAPDANVGPMVFRSETQPPNIRMNLTGYSGLCTLSLAGDAARCARRRKCET